MFSSFMTNTWLVGTMVAIVAGAVGLFVIIRGNIFAAHALPLGTFPGAAAAAYLNINPFWGLIAFAGLGVLGISELGRRQRNDVATALTLITLLGLGTLFLSLSSAYAQGVYSLLFGEILGIADNQVLPVATISLIVLAATAAAFRPLLLTAISPDLAAVNGIPPRRTDLVFLAILALSTAMALPVVGALLVFSLMVGPASAARLLTNRPVPALFLSIAIALATVWSAIALAYLTNWPIGFFVGALAALSYGAGRAWKSLSPAPSQPPPPAPQSLRHAR